MLSGIPRTDYHSAHKRPVHAPPRQEWTDGSSTALVHDLTRGPLPAVFGTCDVLYADLPWQNGYATFNTRAGVKADRPYSGFLTALTKLLEAEERPTYLVTGQHAVKSLPEPSQVIPTRLNEHESVVIVYNAPVTATRYGVSAELLRELALTFERVGDFCCGYGSAPRMFRRQGKTFVASDFNPSCIGYIAAHADEWGPRA